MDMRLERAAINHNKTVVVPSTAKPWVSQLTRAQIDMLIRELGESCLKDEPVEVHRKLDEKRKSGDLSQKWWSALKSIVGNARRKLQKKEESVTLSESQQQKSNELVRSVLQKKSKS